MCGAGEVAECQGLLQYLQSFPRLLLPIPDTQRNTFILVTRPTTFCNGQNHPGLVGLEHFLPDQILYRSDQDPSRRDWIHILTNVRCLLFVKMYYILEAFHVKVELLKESVRMKCRFQM